MTHVLVVEDEPDVSRLLAFNLRGAGFEVATAATGAAALAAATAGEPPTVVVLDLMLPDTSGFEVCRQLRARAATRDVGVLMLTARGDEDDRITGLEAGADDYVVKPFSVREVVLRVTALANRIGERRKASASAAAGAAAPADAAAQLLRCGEVAIDPVTHEVRVAGEAMSLRPLEYKLVATLIAQPGKVFTREELLAEVWGIRGEANTRTVDVHVKRLRTALGVGADVIETVHGFGYRARRDAR